MSGIAVNEIPELVVSQVAAVLGPFQVVHNYRFSGARTMVWKVMAGEKPFVLKLYTQKRKWHPEVFAYQHWVNAYAPYDPELVAIIENEAYQGVLVSEIAGVPLRELEVSGKKKADVYYKCGQLTGNLHKCRPGEWFGIPDFQGFPLYERIDDPVAAMEIDLRKWFTKALNLNCLEKGEIALGEWALENVNVFAGELPLPVNQDYTPGNWLVNEHEDLAGIIDFECMQWGLRADSFAMLWERYFPQNPLLEAAFWDGYGMNPAEVDPFQAFIVCIKIGVGDVACGTENGSERLIRLGRQLLRQMANALSIHA